MHDGELPVVQQPAQRLPVPGAHTALDDRIAQDVHRHARRIQRRGAYASC